jgi:hypothetical protein
MSKLLALFSENAQKQITFHAAASAQAHPGLPLNAPIWAVVIRAGLESKGFNRRVETVRLVLIPAAARGSITSKVVTKQKRYDTGARGMVWMI